jgi:hypothetical protein
MGVLLAVRTEKGLEKEKNGKKKRPLCPQTSSCSSSSPSAAGSQTTSGKRSFELRKSECRSACQAVVDAFMASWRAGGDVEGAMKVTEGNTRGHAGCTVLRLRLDGPGVLPSLFSIYYSLLTLLFSYRRDKFVIHSKAIVCQDVELKGDITIGSGKFTTSHSGLNFLSLRGGGGRHSCTSEGNHIRHCRTHRNRFGLYHRGRGDNREQVQLNILIYEPMVNYPT